MTRRISAGVATFALTTLTVVTSLLPILVFVTVIQWLGRSAELWMLLLVLVFVGYVLSCASDWAVRVETSLHRRFPAWWRS